MSIRWDTGPPRPAPHDGREIWSCPPTGRAYSLRLLGPPIAAWVHWIDPVPGTKGRTTPCQVPRCQLCSDGKHPQRVSYAPALLWENTGPEGKWLPIIAQLSECAEADIREGMGDKAWRGLVITVKRKGRANSRLSASVPEKQLDSPIPEAFEVLPTLLNVWKQQLPAPLPNPPDSTEPRILPFERRAAP